MNHTPNKCPINPDLIEYKIVELDKSFNAFKESIYIKLDELHKEHTKDAKALLEKVSNQAGYTKEEVDHKVLGRAGRWVEKVLVFIGSAIGVAIVGSLLGLILIQPTHASITKILSLIS